MRVLNPLPTVPPFARLQGAPGRGCNALLALTFLLLTICGAVRSLEELRAVWGLFVGGREDHFARRALEAGDEDFGFEAGDSFWLEV